jgi:hypothetical protein
MDVRQKFARAVSAVDMWLTDEEEAHRILWHKKPLSVFLLYVFIGFLWYWNWPITRATVGYAVAALAVAASTMAILGEMGGREKAAWIVLLFAFLFTEFHSIDVERRAQEDIQRETHAEQIGNFRKVGEGITQSMRLSQDHFKGTLSGLEENIKMITGGDSFAYLMTSGIDDSGANLVLLSQGKYPLYDIGFYVFDEKAMYAGTTFEECVIFKQAGIEMGRNPSAKNGEGMAQQLGHIRFKIPGDKQDMNVFFSARNGLWSQAWRWRKVNGQWYWATIVTGQFDSKRFPKGAILFRKVMKGFPKDELANDKTWQQDSKLPLAN